MTLAETTLAARPGILDRLKAETRQAHDRLEAGLGLLDPPLSRQKFTRLLERFWGFHAVWEPAVLRAVADDAFLAPRLKLQRLESDLVALGRTRDEISRLPLCFEAAQLASTPAAAIGSLYVLEGATLGGQVISRALRHAAWLPAGGLTYFVPYGARTGEMWRAFRTDAILRSTPAADAEMAAAARATFERLQLWLT